MSHLRVMLYYIENLVADFTIIDVLAQKKRGNLTSLHTNVLSFIASRSSWTCLVILDKPSWHMLHHDKSRV